MTLTTLGVTFASGAFVTMIALALGVQRQMETPFRALGLLNNIQVKPEEPNGANKPPPADRQDNRTVRDAAGRGGGLSRFSRQDITIRYGDKETTAIGLAMPREAALVNMADEILVAGRFFDENDQPQAILGVQAAGSLGFSNPADAIDKQVTIEAAGGFRDGSGPKAADGDRCRRLLGPAGDAAGAQQGIILPVELMKQIPGIVSPSWPLTSGYASVTVRVRDPAYLDDVAKQIQGMGYQPEPSSAGCRICGGSSW